LIDIIHHNAEVCDSWFDIVDPIVAHCSHLWSLLWISRH